jgi:UPF0176 protein
MKPDTQSPYEILLYYIYTHIEDPDTLRLEQLELCEQLNLKGRIIIGHEGLNGTVGGLRADTQAYIDACAKHPILGKMLFKRSDGIQDAFPKLNIKVRPEIVGAKLGNDDLHPTQITGKYLAPEELHAWYENGEEFTVIDMRNSYEYKFGHFRNSIDPGMRRFEELPKKLADLEEFRNKKVLTVCTGGVRCEKASGYLVKKGFENVYQLEGGMVSYMEKFPGQNFDGSLFVFDGRKTMHFNGENHKPIATCEFCGVTSERFKNCADPFCNKKHIACENCTPKGESRPCPECAVKALKVARS